MSTVQPFSESGIDATPVRKRLGRNPALYLGVAGILAAVVTVILYAVTFFTCCYCSCMYGSVYDPDYVLPVVGLILLSFVSFTVSVGLSTASVLLNASHWRRRENRKGIKALLTVFMIAASVIAVVSVSSAFLYALNNALWTYFLLPPITTGAAIFLSFVSLLVATANLFTVTVTTVGGLVAFCMRRKSMLSNAISAACLLLGPVITLHSACIYGTILLIFNLTMFLIFITLLLLVALGFIAI
jgi:hypothetical protein